MISDNLGVLVARTTRSVAPTEAGDLLLAQVGPALGDIKGPVDIVAARFDAGIEVGEFIQRGARPRHRRRRPLVGGSGPTPEACRTCADGT